MPARIDADIFELAVALIDAERDPTVWWALISPVDSRSIWERLRRRPPSTTPPHVAHALEEAVGTIPDVRDVEWFDPDGELPPTLF